MSKLVIVKLTGDGWDGRHGGPTKGDHLVAVDGPTYHLDGGTYNASKDPDHHFGAKLVGDVSDDLKAVTSLFGSAVEHPSHYNDVEGMPEVWDILDAFFPDNPTIWNAGKYLLRYGRKGDPAEQLRKLKQYVDRELEKLDARTD